MRWSLVAVQSNSKNRTAALAQDGMIYAINGLPAGIRPIDIFKNWDDHRAALEAWTPESATALADVSIEQPLQYPNKLICIGANYTEHRREMKAETEGAKAMPFFFLKPPTTSLIGTGDDIPIRSLDDRVDWEGEVAIVLGKGGRFIDRKDALDCIAGVTLANDLSARGAHQQPNAVHPAFAYDWLASKGQDGFCPLGPGIVPIWFIDNVEDIPFELRVNGKVEQSSTTAFTITGVIDQVVAASQLMTLEPGDVILTGTPAGVGAAQGRFLSDGDEVVVSSPLIGELVNRVRLTTR